MYALLCPKVHTHELSLKVYDNNCEENGTINECMLYPEKFCKGTHLQLNNGQSERICGWDNVFKDMNDNQMVKTDEYTSEITKHAFCACTYESVNQVNIVWSNFTKVVWNKDNDEDNEGGKGEYGVSSGVKTKMEWLPVYGSVKKFFLHLLNVLSKISPMHTRCSWR